MSSALHLAPIGADEFARVSGVAVLPEHERFAGTVAEAFEAAEPGVDFHAMFLGDLAVGFFKIDRRYPTRHTFAGDGDLGLRAYIVDHRQQGRGIGSGAVGLMPAYLRTAYPDSKILWLTVNLQNPGAIACYRKGGFLDTGEIWPHGSAGPQHIMRLALE